MTLLQERYLGILRAFVRQHGANALKSLDRKKYRGIRLGRWVYDRRTRRRKELLSREMIDALESIRGWTWGNYRQDPEFRLRTLKAYFKHHDFSEFRQRIVYRGVPIGNWVNAVKTKYKNGRLSRDMIRRLESIRGWSWQPKIEHHQKMAGLLREFIRRHGWEKFTLETRYRGAPIGRWVERRRYDYGQKCISKFLVRLSQSVPGWRWKAKT